MPRQFQAAGWSRVQAAAICAVLGAALSGCGQRAADQGAIGGEVRFDGKPLATGSVLLTPMQGVKGAVVGGRIENGRYQLAGVAVGQNRVEIRSLRKAGRMVQKPMAPLGQMVEADEEAIPSRFNSASTLTVDVKLGQNTADFEVMSR
jgi:hypothetical protein